MSLFCYVWLIELFTLAPYIYIYIISQGTSFKCKWLEKSIYRGDSYIFSYICLWGDLKRFIQVSSFDSHVMLQGLLASLYGEVSRFTPWLVHKSQKSFLTFCTVWLVLLTIQCRCWYRPTTDFHWSFMPQSGTMNTLTFSYPPFCSILWIYSFQTYYIEAFVLMNIFALLIYHSAAMLCFYSYVVLSGGNPPPKKKPTVAVSWWWDQSKSCFSFWNIFV